MPKKSQSQPDPPTHQEDPLLTPEAVGRLIGKTGRTVRNWCADGLMEAIRQPGGLWMVRRSVVNKFLAGSCLDVNELPASGSI